MSHDSQQRMTSAQALEALQPWRARWTRLAWTPRTSDGDAAVAVAKFGGTPWLAADESWPICAACHNALRFFVQVDLGALPAELGATFGLGLLQLFYCTECDDGWAAFSPSSLVRVVQPHGESHVRPSAELFPPKTITGWEAFADLPGPQDHPQLGLDYHYDFGTSSRTVVVCPERGLDVEVVDADMFAERVGTAAPKDKLAGWPYWVQGPEYPACPRCKRQMRLVFQLDSEDHLPWMFGDAGVGHITQCPEHLDVVAFGWACS